MGEFRVSYDQGEDILYIAKEGIEEEVVELSPGVNLELNKEGQLIGIELFNASRLLRDIITPMQKKLQAA